MGRKEDCGLNVPYIICLIKMGNLESREKCFIQKKKYIIKYSVEN